MCFLVEAVLKNHVSEALLILEENECCFGTKCRCTYDDRMVLGTDVQVSNPENSQQSMHLEIIGQALYDAIQKQSDDMVPVVAKICEMYPTVVQKMFTEEDLYQPLQVCNTQIARTILQCPSINVAHLLLAIANTTHPHNADMLEFVQHEILERHVDTISSSMLHQVMMQCLRNLDDDTKMMACLIIRAAPRVLIGPQETQLTCMSNMELLTMLPILHVAIEHDEFFEDKRLPEPIRRIVLTDNRMLSETEQASMLQDFKNARLRFAAIECDLFMVLFFASYANNLVVVDNIVDECYACHMDLEYAMTAAAARGHVLVLSRLCSVPKLDIDMRAWKMVLTAAVQYDQAETTRLVLTMRQLQFVPNPIFFDLLQECISFNKANALVAMLDAVPVFANCNTNDIRALDVITYIMNIFASVLEDFQTVGVDVKHILQTHVASRKLVEEAVAAAAARQSEQPPARTRQPSARTRHYQQPHMLLMQAVKSGMEVFASTLQAMDVATLSSISVAQQETLLRLITSQPDMLSLLLQHLAHIGCVIPPAVLCRLIGIASFSGSYDVLRVVLEQTDTSPLEALVPYAHPECVLLAIQTALSRGMHVKPQNLSAPRQRAVMHDLQEEMDEMHVMALSFEDDDDDDELFVCMLCGPLLDYQQLIMRRVQQCL